MSSGPSSAHHVAQRRTSLAAATPSDQTVTWMSPPGGGLQPVLMRPTPQLSVKTRGGGAGGGGQGVVLGGGVSWGE